MHDLAGQNSDIAVKPDKWRFTFHIWPRCAKPLKNCFLVINSTMGMNLNIIIGQHRADRIDVARIHGRDTADFKVGNFG